MALVGDEQKTLVSESDALTTRPPPCRPALIKSYSCYYQIIKIIIKSYSYTNAECATQYTNDQFSILAKARSMFHLSVLEATYIKIRKPILSRQKKFVYSLQIFH